MAARGRGELGGPRHDTISFVSSVTASTPPSAFVPSASSKSPPASKLRHLHPLVPSRSSATSCRGVDLSQHCFMRPYRLARQTYSCGEKHGHTCYRRSSAPDPRPLAEYRPTIPARRGSCPVGEPDAAGEQHLFFGTPSTRAARHRCRGLAMSASGGRAHFSISRRRLDLRGMPAGPRRIRLRRGLDRRTGHAIRALVSTPKVTYEHSFVSSGGTRPDAGSAMAMTAAPSPDGHHPLFDRSGALPGHPRSYAAALRAAGA